MHEWSGVNGDGRWMICRWSERPVSAGWPHGVILNGFQPMAPRQNARTPSISQLACSRRARKIPGPGHPPQPPSPPPPSREILHASHHLFFLSSLLPLLLPKFASPESGPSQKETCKEYLPAACLALLSHMGRYRCWV